MDYLTSPGWVQGGESRYSQGLNRGGIFEVITDRCILKFREDNRKMYLSHYYLGFQIEDILANTGFELDTSQAKELKAPTGEELQIIREKVDPDRLILSPKYPL